MHNQTMNLEPDLEKFIANDPRHVDLLFNFFMRNKKLSAEVYANGLNYLDSCLQKTSSAQILTAKALWIYLYPASNELDDSLALFSNAVAQGNLLAHTGKALCFIKIKEVPKKFHAEAVSLLRTASESGCKIAMTYLALCHIKGIGVTKNVTEAIRLYKIASEAGFPIATMKLGFLFFLKPHKEIQQDVTKAAQLFKIASDAGFSEATGFLAMCYASGKGVCKNMTEAIRLYRIASDAGDRIAAFDLACIYQEGIDVPQDLTEAVRLYRIASASGNNDATHNLAVLYEKGLGVPQDANEALRLYHIAAKAGNSRSNHNIGSYYYNRTAVKKDLNTAVSYYIPAIINATDVDVLNETLSCLDTVLKELLFKPALIIDVAQCCAGVCRKQSHQNAHSKAKEILCSLQKAAPDNFEVQYVAAMVFGDSFLSGWLFNSIGATHRHISSAIKQLIAKDPNQFIACLMKDNFNTASYKQALYVYIVECYLPKLSGDSIITCLHSLNELDKLRQNPKSYFSLLSPDIINVIAQSAARFIYQKANNH